MRPSKSDKDKLKFMNEISFVEKKQNVSPWKIVSKSDGQSKNCYGDENTIKKYIKTKVNNDVVNLPTDGSKKELCNLSPRSCSDGSNKIKKNSGDDGKKRKLKIIVSDVNKDAAKITTGKKRKQKKGNSENCSVVRKKTHTRSDGSKSTSKTFKPRSKSISKKSILISPDTDKKDVVTKLKTEDRRKRKLEDSSCVQRKKK